MASLKKLEKRIEDNAKAYWFESNLIMLKIRDENLWGKKKYGTFENYLKVRWNYGKSYGHELMNAAEFMQITYKDQVEKVRQNEVLADFIEPVLPKNERQCRPLLRKLNHHGERIKVWAEVVDKTEARDLIPLITRQVERGTTVCSDTWRAYTGRALRGYVHRLVKHREKEYVSKTDKKNHINGLEGFWGYLKRKLAAKGGVRRKHLHLFLGEYVWRYNHRGLEANEKIDRLLNLVIKFSG